ncbi:MAG: hypothetical protein H6Q05_3126 [Acidobacteria bacterium]|nr:hypothetical protein [Acidobacteriota bacterium]
MQAKAWVSTLDQAEVRVSTIVGKQAKAWVSTLDQAKMRVSRIVVGVQQPALCVSEALRGSSGSEQLL